MSTTVLPQLPPATPPRARGRLAGFVYLLFFLTAILAQLLTSRNLVFAGNAANLVSIGFYLALGVLFYSMFKPVNQRLSLLAALFNFAGCIVMTVGLFYPNLPISPLWFFGTYCLLIGYLVFQSTFLPRTLGVLMLLAGLGWLVFLFPYIALHLAIYIEALGVVAEAALMIWLIAMGVNVDRWNQLAVPARSQK